MPIQEAGKLYEDDQFFYSFRYNPKALVVDYIGQKLLLVSYADFENLFNNRHPYKVTEIRHNIRVQDSYMAEYFQVSKTFYYDILIPALKEFQKQFKE